MANIVIVDEQPVTRHALRLLLEAEGHNVVAEADNGIDAIQLGRTGDVALMILELVIPRLGGLAVIERLADSGPKLLVLTAQNSEYFAIRCLEAGAAGFVSKQDDLSELKAAVSTVLRGQAHFPSQVLNPAAHAATGHDAVLRALSSRELSVLQLLAKGLSNVAIADQLALSDKTISTYKIRLKQKLNAASLLEVIDIARSHGLIEGATEPARPFAEPDAGQQQELELLRKVLDALPCTVVVRDTEGRVITCNRWHLQQFDVTLDEIRGKRMIETRELDAATAALAHRTLMAAMERQLPYTRDVVLNLGGEERTFRHWGHPYVDAQGRFLGMICGNVELTDRDRLLLDLRNAHEHAQAGNRTKQAFMVAMGTEMAEPLHRIMAMLDLAQQPQYPGRNEALELARNAAASLLTLLDDLQALNRLEAGRFLLAPEPLDLRAALRLQIEALRPQAEAKQLQIELDTELARQPGVWIDPHAWKQLIGNLVGNAIKFTDAGRITVALSAHGRGQGMVEVLLQVEDSGIGIAPTDQVHLFEPFTQVLDSQRIHRGGSGLGLALCKRLVDQMGGRISLESELGLGTRMEVGLILTQLKSG
ncbi:ATP-binding protein [Chitinolyticbacter albus]|uniref:ATP-binding protein n=1 Tax=Chitinolyticbacter albus TaxID=2961951 RepID=UPI00210D426B|nr:ATP-binding protein [Chitinolyticbacter albus]